MKTSILATAAGLSDHDLLARLALLASREREACVELLAHLAALDSRPSVYAARGYGSLFSDCTHALRLSEDAACNRIEAARTCRRFPVILDLLASGEVTLTAVRLLGRHLTPGNHQAVFAKAKGAIFDRALTLLLEKVENKKLGAAAKPRPVGAIRPRTDKSVRKSDRPSRHVPRNVKRAVWRRDGGQCAFVASGGRRCSERTYLEFHHMQAHAHQGPPHRRKHRIALPAAQPVRGRADLRASPA